MSTVLVARAELAERSRHGDVAQVIADCPYCEGTHRHGLTDDLRDGQRSPRHADCGAGTYLVEPPGRLEI